MLPLININIKVNIELNSMASVYCSGARLTIRITDDGYQSIKNLCEVHRHQIIKELARANALLKTFAENGRLRSPDQFRNEGDKFWAIRAGTIRCYGWYEADGSFVISHVISKRHDKLEDGDKRRMIKNQAEFRSENGEAK